MPIAIPAPDQCTAQPEKFDAWLAGWLCQLSGVLNRPPWSRGRCGTLPPAWGFLSLLLGGGGGGQRLARARACEKIGLDYWAGR